MDVLYNTKFISIHALREEGDRRCTSHYSSSFVFQSTPSARRATGMSLPTSMALRISIHALREEGDDPHIVQDCSRF